MGDNFFVKSALVRVGDDFEAAVSYPGICAERMSLGVALTASDIPGVPYSLKLTGPLFARDEALRKLDHTFYFGTTLKKRSDLAWKQSYPDNTSVNNNERHVRTIVIDIGFW